MSGRATADGTAPQAGPEMASILTSWKEISQYLGKGVRTVQRWEREAGLPVRRRENHTRHGVLAITEELDEWARSRTRGPAGPLADSLRREIAILRDEFLELRARVDELESQTATSGAIGWMTDTFITDGNGRDGATITKPSRATAGEVRAQMIRTRISIASTLCAMAAKGFQERDRRLLGSAQHAALKIRECLDFPGYVPWDTQHDLRASLEELQSMINAAEVSPNRQKRAVGIRSA